MKRAFLSSLCAASLWALPAHAAPQVFTSEAAFLAAASGATTLDFNATSTGAIAGDAFAGQGFVFESLAGSGLSIIGADHYLNIGDVVRYPHTDGPRMRLGDGYGDWNLNWAQWSTGGLISTR